MDIFDNKQNPFGRSGRQWCPGGRDNAYEFRFVPFSTEKIASFASPADKEAISKPPFVKGMFRPIVPPFLSDNALKFSKNFRGCTLNRSSKEAPLCDLASNSFNRPVTSIKFFKRRFVSGFSGRPLVGIGCTKPPSGRVKAKSPPACQKHLSSQIKLVLISPS